MKKAYIIGGFGMAGAILLGVGVSFAHSGGLFGPSEPDWLTLSKQTPVVVPTHQDRDTRAVTVVPFIEFAEPEQPVVAAPFMGNTNDERDAQVVVIAPQAPSFAPISSIAPHSRPEIVQAVSQASARPQPSQQIVAVRPNDAVPFVTEDFQTRAKIPTSSSPVIDRSLLTPPDVARSEADPVDNVWLLGVFR